MVRTHRPAVSDVLERPVAVQDADSVDGVYPCAVHHEAAARILRTADGNTDAEDIADTDDKAVAVDTDKDGAGEVEVGPIEVERPADIVDTEPEAVLPAASLVLEVAVVLAAEVHPSVEAVLTVDLPDVADGVVYPFVGDAAYGAEDRRRDREELVVHPCVGVERR